MNLCIDIGNSRTKIGVFQGTKLLEKVTIPAISETDIHALSEKYLPEAAIWSSVAGTDDLNECFPRVSYPVLELKHDTTLPFT
ncbi:MAG: type III pantothenate kinase, partial [Bacteroidota bacterium]